LSGCAAAGALRRDAPARGLLAYAAVGQAGALPGRAVRRARRDHTRRDAGMARAHPDARAAHCRARHPRRRGGDPARRPRRRALPPTRQGDRGAGRTRAPPARAHGRRGDRPARARARGPACRSLRARGDGVSVHSTAAPPARRGTLRRGALALLPPVLLVALLLGVWEAYVDAGATSSFVLPAPHAIAAAGWENAGFLAANLGPT